MPATVPVRPVTLSAAPVKPGLTVASTDWTAIAGQANHIMGMSSALVPLHSPDVTIAAAGTGYFRHYVFPRYQATHRLWLLTVTTATGFADLTVTFDGGGVATLRASEALGWVPLYEELAVQTATEGPIDLTIDNAAGGSSAVVRALACYELGRSELAVYPNGEAGVSAETLRAALPIFDGSAEGKSLSGVTGLVDLSLATARRTGLFASAPMATSTSASFASPFSRPFVVRGRKLYRTSTTAVMQVRAYCTTPVGTVGEVRFTMTSGATVTITIPSNTGGWVQGSLAIDCDDFADAYGRRSTRFDKCTVEFRRVSGAGTVGFDHVFGGEA